VHGEPDDALEEELRRAAARIEPVPPELVDAAVGAFTWRTIDAELAELTFDSLLNQDQAALVRGGEQGRLLSFRASGLSIEVEVTGGGNVRRLVGQLMPPQRATVAIRHGNDLATVAADELGRFSIGLLHAGPISLRCTLGSETAQPPVVTDWVSI
jgi:hypothetical protein